MNEFVVLTLLALAMVPFLSHQKSTSVRGCGDADGIPPAHPPNSAEILQFLAPLGTCRKITPDQSRNFIRLLLMHISSTFSFYNLLPPEFALAQLAKDSGGIIVGPFVGEVNASKQQIGEGLRQFLSKMSVRCSKLFPPNEGTMEERNSARNLVHVGIIFSLAQKIGEKLHDYEFTRINEALEQKNRRERQRNGGKGGTEGGQQRQDGAGEQQQDEEEGGHGRSKQHDDIEEGGEQSEVGDQREQSADQQGNDVEDLLAESLSEEEFEVGAEERECIDIIEKIIVDDSDEEMTAGDQQLLNMPSTSYSHPKFTYSDAHLHMKLHGDQRSLANALFNWEKIRAEALEEVISSPKISQIVREIRADGLLQFVASNFAIGESN